jgi:phosphate transport system protein
VKRFIELLDQLQHQLLELAALVESTIHQGVTATLARSASDSRAVIAQQRKIDELAAEIYTFVTDLLALHQPVAGDLALLTAALKISSDLKRMGELSVNIAQRSIALSERPAIPFPDGIVEMAHRVQAMVSKSLQAFAQRQEELATQVIAADDDVDRLRTTMYGDLVKQMEEQPRSVAQEVDLMFIVHNLERIGDHATNIAEDVVLFVGGKNRTRWAADRADTSQSPNTIPSAVDVRFPSGPVSNNRT